MNIFVYHSKKEITYTFSSEYLDKTSFFTFGIQILISHLNEDIIIGVLQTRKMIG